ncbi:MAG: hypothetical protein RLZZ245_3786 [Verrucomicrobiota bacterium]
MIPYIDSRCKLLYQNLKDTSGNGPKKCPTGHAP